ncbi:hypothetical protein D3C83_44470 [compost metagenome]
MCTTLMDFSGMPKCCTKSGTIVAEMAMTWRAHFAADCTRIERYLPAPALIQSGLFTASASQMVATTGTPLSFGTR